MKFFLYFLLFSSNLIFSQNYNNPNYKYWKEGENLKITDFEKIKINEILKDSIIMGKSVLTLDYFIDKDRIINVIPVFDKKKSYLLKNANVNETLKHEQIHFDILELFARKLRKLLVIEFEKNYEMDLNFFLDRLNEQMKLYSEFNKKYDYETNRLLNIENQIKWKRVVNKELDRYKDYSQEKYLEKIRELLD